MTNSGADNKTWKIAPLLKTTEDYFKSKNIEPARLDAEVLLSSILKCERIRLYTDFEKILSDEELSAYRNLVKRRACGEPVAYILGEKEFYSIKFKVNKNVLIPRPETEHLVEETINIIKQYFPKNQTVKILDIGTGSGCIAVALAANLDNVSIIATDISEEALNTAAMNSVLNKVDEKIEFRMGNLFEPVKNEKFDIIVSNPPYIAEDDKNVMEDVRKYEPHSALFAENNGMYFYENISSTAESFLNNKGVLVFEAGAGQADKISGLLRNTTLKSHKVISDHAGIDRVVVATSFPLEAEKPTTELSYEPVVEKQLFNNNNAASEISYSEANENAFASVAAEDEEYYKKLDRLMDEYAEGDEEPPEGFEENDS